MRCVIAWFGPYTRGLYNVYSADQNVREKWIVILLDTKTVARHVDVLSQVQKNVCWCDCDQVTYIFHSDYRLRGYYGMRTRSSVLEYNRRCHESCVSDHRYFMLKLITSDASDGMGREILE